MFSTKTTSVITNPHYSEHILIFPSSFLLTICIKLEKKHEKYLMIISASDQGNNSRHQIDPDQSSSEERHEGDADVRVERQAAQELIVSDSEQLVPHPSSKPLENFIHPREKIIVKNCALFASQDTMS